MLIDLLDKITSKVSSKKVAGRSLVIDLMQSKEKRLMHLKLPDSRFCFEIFRSNDDFLIRLIEGEDGKVTVLGTYASQAEAEKVLKRLRFKMIRPLKQLVMICLGFIIVTFAWDVMTSSHSQRMGLSEAEQQKQMLQMLNKQKSGLPYNTPMNTNPAQNVPQPSTAPVTPSNQPESSPEAKAALGLLSGK